MRVFERDREGGRERQREEKKKNKGRKKDIERGGQTDFIVRESMRVMNVYSYPISKVSLIKLRRFL